MKVIFTLHFLFLSAFLFAQSKDKKDLQDLRAQCQQLIEKGDFPKLAILAREALSITPKSDLYNLAAFNFFIGVSKELPQNYDSAVHYLEISVGLARQTNDAEVISKPMRRLVLAYYAAAETKKLDKIAKELQHIADTTKIEELKIDNNGILANYYAAKGLHQKQLAYLLEDLTYYKRKYAEGKDKQRVSDNLAEDLLKIAELYYINLNQADKAIAYLNEAKPYISEDNTPAIIFYHKFYADALLIKDNVAASMVHYDSITKICEGGFGMACNIRFSLDLTLAENYLEKAIYADANIFLKRANDLAPKYAQDPPSVAQLNFLKGKILLSQNQFAQALPFLSKASEFSQSVSADFNANVQHLLSQCYAGMGLWSLAYQYAQKTIQLQDSSYKEKTEQSLANAEAKYQNNSKQQQINSQHAKLAYAAKQKLWLIGGLVLAGLIAALLVIIYRNKKRTADVLDEKNRTLGKLNNDLQEANQTKAKLFGIISHDLRSPISQVYQFLKLQQMAPDRLDEAQREKLSNKIQSATGSLLETMEDLLLWSKTQMNNFNTDMQPVAVDEVVGECLQLLQLNIEAKNITISNHLPSEIIVKSDPYFLQTILRNLLQNAIKASPENGELIIRYKDKQLSITNSGGHFSQKEYEQVLASKEDANSLSGLGLRLVDELSKKIGVQVYFAEKLADYTSAYLSF